jgi:hypothetical protein
MRLGEARRSRHIEIGNERMHMAANRVAIHCNSKHSEGVLIYPIFFVNINLLKLNILELSQEWSPPQGFYLFEAYAQGIVSFAFVHFCPKNILH